MPAELQPRSGADTLENTSGGADPLVRGRRPRRPARNAPKFDSIGDCGSRGPPADQGVRPTMLVQSPVFMPIHAGAPAGNTHLDAFGKTTALATATAGAGRDSEGRISLLIIGYGNPIRGDDGVGYRAAERLRCMITEPTVEVLAVHQLTPELADPISRALRVIFIDAAATGEPCTIQRRTISPIPAPGGFTHHSTPDALLALSLTLFGAAPDAILYSIPGQSFAIGEGLTPAVEQVLDKLVSELVTVRPFESCTRGVR